jgi:DNA primase
MLIPYNLRHKIDVEDALHRLGVPVRRKLLGEITSLCPSPDHDDRSPSWSIVTNPQSEKFGRHNCFSCGFKGDLITLWKTVREIRSRQVAYEEIKAIYGNNEEVNEYDLGLDERDVIGSTTNVLKFVEMPYEFELVEEGSAHWNWFLSRGISEEMILKQRLGYCTDKDKRMPGWAMFPVFFGGDTVGYFGRSMIQKKQLYSNGLPISQIWYNWDNVNLNKKEIFITEGIIDCLRVLSTGYVQSYRGHQNVVATLGNRIQLPRSTMLMSFDRIISVADGDAGGRVLEQSIMQNFDNHAQLLKVPLPEGTDPGDVDKSILRRGINSPSMLKNTPQSGSRLIDYSVRN